MTHQNTIEIVKFEHSLADVKAMTPEKLQEELIKISPIAVNFIDIKIKFWILKKFKLTGKGIYDTIGKMAYCSGNNVKAVLRGDHNNSKVNQAFTTYLQTNVMDNLNA